MNGREKTNAQISSSHLILGEDKKEYFINLRNDAEMENVLNNIENHSLKAYILSGELRQTDGKTPPSINAMKHLQLVNYASGSDSGHVVFYPKGKQMFDILANWTKQIAENLDCLEIMTPILYDWSDSEIRSQGESFHERHYVVTAGQKEDDEEKEFVLRFAGDFGLFKMIKNAQLSYRDLPIRIFEFSESFRNEQSGELRGLQRLRGFHMPDIHSFAPTINSGWDEYFELHKEYSKLADATGVEYALVFRIVKSFYEQNKEKIAELTKISGKPAFIELLSDMKHYWVIKHEFQNIDSIGTNMQLSTVQLDVVDSQRYGINYVDKDGLQKGCTICHSSIGSIERWMYAILEEALKKEKPVLPFWISPTQIRMLPIYSDSEDQNQSINNLVQKLSENKFRVEVDDRKNSLSWKIRDAEKNWIPYILVVGKNEVKTNTVSVRNRYDNTNESISLDKFIDSILLKTKNVPYKNTKNTKPTYLNRMPTFI